MTERRLFESAIGLPGRLSHIPYGADKPESGGWFASREVNHDAPILRELGPCRTWIPAESNHILDSGPSEEREYDKNRRQRRWLLKSHAEASLDADILREYLGEENSPFSSREDIGSHSCFLAIGELTDFSNLVGTCGAPLLVTVVGEGNNALRFMRLNQEEWQWPRQLDAAVRLTGISNEEPALWAEDHTDPVHRVKCFVDLQRSNPTRWVAAQRDSGTTIFRPEYHKIPPVRGIGQAPSHIAVNPLFEVPKEATGGNVHTDVAFNPPTRSNPAQLAIVDERGFWSVWNVLHPKARASGPTPKLNICGHIELGVLDHMPHGDAAEMKWHKIVWVGCSEDELDMFKSLDLDADDEEPESNAPFPPLKRSSLLLVYNFLEARLFDLSTSSYLPDLAFTSLTSPDGILDIQANPENPEYYYVLTTLRLFVVRTVSKAGLTWDKPERSSSILFSTPHFRSFFDRSLKLIAARGTRSNQAVSSLIFIHSSIYPWNDVFCIEVSKEHPDRVRCQRNLAAFGELQNITLQNTMQTMSISAVATAGDNALELAGQHLSLYQITALTSNHSVVSTLCMSPGLPNISIEIPRDKVTRSTRQKLNRRHILRDLTYRFVVPDDLAILEEKPLIKSINARDLPGDGVPEVYQRFIKPFYDYLNEIVANRLNPQAAESSKRATFGSNPFDAAHYYIEEALAKGSLPLRTLNEMMPSFNEVAKHPDLSLDWSNEIERLDHAHPDISIITFDLLRSSLGLPPDASFQEASSVLLDIIGSQLGTDEVDEASERHKAMIFGQMRYDLFLSLFGLGYRRPEITEPELPNAANSRQQSVTSEAMTMDSQTETLPSSPARSHSPGTSSQRSNSEPVEEEDPAMTLLRSYTGTGKFVPRKEFELLDKWQLGAQPSDYVFDIDRETDAGPMARTRAKQLAKQDRKRRRAETLLNMGREPQLPNTQPLPETRFFSSQPRAAESQLQSDPVQAMSQPIAGAFGVRPKKKVKKRKGGF
ncbi:hypothetical protein GGR57DRAFT_463987 [Xylariaceae sp. FL1272]|nr:hypothetical protein GGR57DRAFT_463987 [Xylariaceae sp. FL1272]